MLLFAFFILRVESIFILIGFDFKTWNGKESEDLKIYNIGKKEGSV